MDRGKHRDFVSVSLAKLALGQLRGEDVPEVASTLLESGTDSDQLAVLAGERNPTMSEIEPALRAALVDAGVQVPSVEEATLCLARQIAQQILSGQIAPYEGARRIWWELANVEGAHSRLTAFVGLASEYEDATHESFRKDYEKLIVEEAKSIVGE